MPPKRLLVVDDDRLICWAMEKELVGSKIDARTVGTAADALAELRRQSYDLVFLDMSLPGFDGIDLLQEIREIQADAKVVVMSTLADEKRRQRAFAVGALQFLDKPFDIRNVHSILRSVFGEFPRRRESPRHFCRIPLCLSILDPPPEDAEYDLNSVSGIASDFSLGGFRVHTEYPLRVGQRVRARTDAENAHFRRLVSPESSAEVVWAAPVQQGVTAGLKLVNRTTPTRTSLPGTAGSRR